MTEQLKNLLEHRLKFLHIFWETRQKYIRPTAEKYILEQAIYG